MSNKTLLGQPLPRLDAQQKVTGSYIYGMDHHLEGALESAVLRSPHPHARILRIDTSRAEALEGVRGVLTGRDFPDLLMPGTVDDQPLLTVDRVRFHGEPVALIAAENRAIAGQGLRLVEADYELLPVITDPEAAMQPGAALLPAHHALRHLPASQSGKHGFDDSQHAASLVHALSVGSLLAN